MRTNAYVRIRKTRERNATKVFENEKGVVLIMNSVSVFWDNWRVLTVESMIQGGNNIC